jgi:ubiquinone/menaquinone biosynthesis C-methylase UbiE
MLEPETEKTKKRYDRTAKFYDQIESFIENKLFGKLRKETFGDLKSNILEIGIGTGKNIPYYGKGAKITGIDLSPKMLEKAQVKAKKLKTKVQLLQMDAQHLDFKNNSFDYVIGSFVLCSIPYPVKALKEIKRVTKENGKIIFIEHVLSKNKLIALCEKTHNPITRRLFGFNINRKTGENILKSGLIIENDEKLALKDVFRRFTCLKKGA